MLGKAVLLRTSSSDTTRRASALLRAAGNEVVTEGKCSACQLVLEAGGIDLLVVDTRDGSDIGSLTDQAYRRRIPVIVLADTPDAETIELFCDGLSNHLIFGNESIEAMAVSAEKILRREFFGLDKYAGRYGVETYKFELAGGNSLRDALECLDEFMGVVQIPQHLAASVLSVAGELGENALYSAPRTPEGRRCYSPSDRHAGIDVEAWEHAQLQYTFDGERILVSVNDWFGSLDPARLRNALWRRRARASTRPNHLERKPGRGIRHAWEHTSELIFNISPKKQTEVIASIELIGERARGGLHLHYDGDTLATKSAPQTIRVSDSMLVDIRQHIAKRQPAPAIILETKAEREVFEEQTDPLGQVIPADEEAVGIDTMLGLLHGCTSLERCIEVGLRFMAQCYEGAVAFAVKNERLMAIAAAGEICDWPELQSLRPRLFGGSTFAELVRTGITDRYLPSSTNHLDTKLLEMTAGTNDTEGYVVTIDIAGEPQFAFFAFAPKYRLPMAKRVAKHLRSELRESISKQLGFKAIYTTRRKSSCG